MKIKKIKKPKPSKMLKNKSVTKITKQKKGFGDGLKRTMRNQRDALKQRLNTYGIGVDDVKARAKQLEQVLKDLRNRDFLKQPGVQTLVEKVTKKSVEKSNQEAQRAGQRIPNKRKKMAQKEGQRNSQKNRLKRDTLFSALSESKAQQLGQNVVQAIIKRVDDVRRSISETATSAIRRKK